MQNSDGTNYWYFADDFKFDSQNLTHESFYKITVVAGYQLGQKVLVANNLLINFIAMNKHTNATVFVHAVILCDWLW